MSMDILALIPGYQSIARYHSDIDTVVVQFVNTAGGTPIVPVFDVQGGTKVMVAMLFTTALSAFCTSNQYC